MKSKQKSQTKLKDREVLSNRCVEIALLIRLLLCHYRKKGQGGNLSRKIIGWCREYFFESLALADRDDNFF